MHTGLDTPVRHLPRNVRGTDYVVGDIHGCFDLVLRAMDKVAFDQSRDRILSVGDLIDRGPGSARCVRFLSHDWVVAVRGNHEDMLLQAYADGEPHPAVLEYMSPRNGFGWWDDTPDSVRADVLAAVRRLPLAVEVDTPRGTVGLVHADVPRGMAWGPFLKAIEAGDEAVTHVALWGRDRLHRHDLSGVEGVGRVFVGHTPLARTTRIGNVYAIDTGAVFGVLRDDGALTFADVMTQTNAFTTLESMDAPADLVRVLAEARDSREARRFSDLLGR